MKKLTLFIFLILAAFFFIFAIKPDSNNDVQASLSDKIFRLHVIANSDSDDDQNLKLKVKEVLVNYMEDNCSGLADKDAYIEYAETNREKLLELAQQTVHDEGYDYPVYLSVENTFFPVKTYGDLTFPSGYYDALCIRIGNAAGRNWWCVLYPPLCFVDLTYGVVPDNSKDMLHSIIGDNDYYALISDNENIKVKPRFLIIDALKDLFD